ncbi:MAG TPA: VOC family protein [Candidatus Udaeobacter sp.]|nr:VOC family protein [Candidatus Udaeobacter sp.]
MRPSRRSSPHESEQALTAPFTLRGLDHVVLRVRDAARMERFYCEVVGCVVARRRTDLGLTHLGAGSTMIDLVDINGPLGRKAGPSASTEGHNMDHLCLRVTPFDAAAIAVHLRAHGVEPREIGTRFGAEGDGPSLYLDDPEGNRVELKGPSVEAAP